MKYVLCDIDGCLINLEHRLGHVMKGDFETGWKADQIIKAGQATYAALAKNPTLRLAFNTSRPEHTRAITEAQLKIALPNAKWDLWMRPEGNTMPDNILKLWQLSSRNIAAPQVLLAFDDRKIICQAYRQHNIVAYQTAVGY